MAFTIDRKKLLPCLLAALVIAADQITKALVVRYIPPFSIGAQFFGDFLRIVHVSNTGVAFSMGDSMPAALRRLFFAVVPLAVIILVIVVYFRNNTFTALQRWAVCGIIGGGIGNLIDRFFRSAGVVDFIDVKFFGIFGLNRWPTFNVADSAVVVCGILLAASFLLSVRTEAARNSPTES
ncbi:MAG: signal peptidase II [Treponemataceae bacterium]|nr:signal peptidase II [Treponemataceae bacterium]